tara:strand:- start:355 stop:561 length:207 start_codon:yes stop_codon:yes gene_type:complete
MALLEWDIDDEHCAYNSLFGYHCAKFAEGNVVLRSPICGSSRHDDLASAKTHAEEDIKARLVQMGVLR